MPPSITYAHARQNLKSSFDLVTQTHEPLLVERRNGGNVVFISEEDFSSLQETAYLLKSPKNAKRLLASLEVSKKDRVKFDTLKDLSDEIRI